MKTDNTQYQISTLSSGTLARLFKTNNYAEINEKHEKWILWVEENRDKVNFVDWVDAWEKYLVGVNK